MKLWKTWFSHLKHNVFTILIARKKHHFSLVSSDIKIFMKKVKKCALRGPGGQRRSGEGPGGSKGRSEGSRGGPWKSSFSSFLEVNFSTVQWNIDVFTSGRFCEELGCITCIVVFWSFFEACFLQIIEVNLVEIPVFFWWFRFSIIVWFLMSFVIAAFSCKIENMSFSRDVLQKLMIFDDSRDAPKGEILNISRDV